MSEGASASGQGSPTPSAAPEQAQAGQPTKERIQNPTVADGESTGRLPGVLDPGISNEGELDVAEQLFGSEDDGETGDKKTRLRGPDGKFLRQSKEQGGDERVQLPDGADVEPEPAAQKFKFAGEEWDSQEKAEQNFKTLRGMHKAQEQRIAAESARANENWTAYEAWKRYGEAQAARVAELERGGGQTPQPQGQPSGVGNGEFNVENVVKGIDWDAYNYVATHGSLAKGGEYLIGEVMRLVQEQMLPAEINKLRAEVQQQLQPLAEERQHTETVNAMTTAATQLASLQTPDGRVAFPELGNVAEVEKIGYYWAREAASEADAQRRLQLLQTPQGLMQAIALYRLVKNIEEAPSTTPQGGNGAAAGNFPVEAPAPGPAASLGVRGDEGFRPGPRSNLSPAMARMVNALGTGDMIDKSLGFARNR